MKTENKAPKPERTRFTIDIQKPLLNEITAKAKQEQRSVSGQIRFMLKCQLGHIQE